MKKLEAFLIAGVLACFAASAHSAPQASATASLNFTLTFKDGSGAVLDTSYLHTDVGFDILYNRPVYVGPAVNQTLVHEGLSGVPVVGFNQTRSGSLGTGSGEASASGAYASGVSSLGMSSHAEVGGGLANAQWEYVTAGPGLYNLIFSAGTEPLYLHIAYSYSISFQTTVLDPLRAWEWQAGGSVTMNLIGGGERSVGGEWQYVYPNGEPSPVFDSSRGDLFRIYYSEWVAGAPSGTLTGSESLAPIALSRDGFAAISWGLSAGAGASATAPGVEAPIPEPETYAMLLAGLGLLALFARPRRRQAS